MLLGCPIPSSTHHTNSSHQEQNSPLNKRRRRLRAEGEESQSMKNRVAACSILKFLEGKCEPNRQMQIKEIGDLLNEHWILMIKRGQGFQGRMIILERL